jgi:hypothetical protein
VGRKAVANPASLPTSNLASIEMIIMQDKPLDAIFTANKFSSLHKIFFREYLVNDKFLGK